MTTGQSARRLWDDWKSASLGAVRFRPQEHADADVIECPEEDALWRWVFGVNARAGLTRTAVALAPISRGEELDVLEQHNTTSPA